MCWILSKRDWVLGIRDWGFGFQTKNYGICSHPSQIFECFPSTQYPVPSPRAAFLPHQRVRVLGDSSPQSFDIYHFHQFKIPNGTTLTWQTPSMPTICKLNVRQFTAPQFK